MSKVYASDVRIWNA